MCEREALLRGRMQCASAMSRMLTSVGKGSERRVLCMIVVEPCVVMK